MTNILFAKLLLTDLVLAITFFVSTEASIQIAECPRVTKFLASCLVACTVAMPVIALCWIWLAG